MANIAVHIVGMFRNFDLTVNSFKHLINDVRQGGKNSVVVFVSVWDKFSSFDFSGSKRNQELLDLDKQIILSQIADKFENAQVVINIHKFDASIDKGTSFLKCIYLSYLDRLRFELVNGQIFDRVIVSRSDVVFFPKLHNDFASTLLGENFNIINGVKNSAFRIPSGMFTFDSPNPSFRLLPSAYDFTFFGSFREMNILMRTYTFINLLQNQYVSAHLLIVIVLKKFGIHLGDVNNYLAPKIFRKEKGQLNQYFTEDQFAFSANLTPIKKIIEQNDRIWWSIVNRV